jgi:hypothetical protein
MKTLTSAHLILPIVVCVMLSTGNIYAQDNKKPESPSIKMDEIKIQKKNYILERKKQKLEDKHDRKVNKRYIRKIARPYSRRVWELVYDAGSRELVSSKLILSEGKEPEATPDTIPFPPSEIHEYDGVKVKFINLNPFMYRINLIEVQSDRINSEELSSYEFQVGAEYSVNPITQLKIVRPKVPVPDKEYLDKIVAIDSLDKELSSKKDTLLRLLSIDTTFAKNLVKSILKTDTLPKNKDDLESTNFPPFETPEFLPDGSEPTKFYPDLSEPTKVILLKFLNDLDLQIKSIENNLQTKRNEFSSARLETSQILDTNKSKSLASTSLEVLSGKMIKILEEINEFIYFHNQFVNVFNLPQSKYSEINKKRNSLLQTIYGSTDLERVYKDFAENKMEVQSKIIEIQNTLRFIENSKIFKEAEFNYDLGAYDQALKDLNQKITELDFGAMIRRVRDLDELLSEENFTLTYQSLDISENADYKSIQVDFDQINGKDVPKGRGSFKFNMGFMIREGVKIDVSPTIMFESGIVPSDFYFEPEPDQPGFARVVKNGNDQNALGIGALLNVYKRSAANLKVGGSAGFGISQNVEPRFSVGPTLIIGRKERAIISAGAIFGQTTRPIARYQTNELIEVTDDLLQAGVPLEKGNIGVGYYIGVGFNLFGLKNKEVIDTGFGRFTSK